MNNTTVLALIVLSVLPASAQKVLSPDCSAKADTAIVAARDYAARVDGLLRDAHASLRSISERVEAGSMSLELAEKLKLAVARDTISRLDAISAVYDVRLNKNGVIENGTQAAAGDNCTTDKVRPTPNGDATVSVKELKSESAFCLEAAGRGPSSRDSNEAIERR